MKSCCTCGQSKALEEFQKDRTKKDGHSGVCKMCRKTYVSKWQKEHPDNCKNNSSVWRKNNLSKHSAKEGRRRAAKLQRTPRWLTKEELFEIDDFYAQARELGKIFFNRKFEVDHIIPLQGENVSGLHVPSNLQILTEQENRKKHNMFKV